MLTDNLLSSLMKESVYGQRARHSIGHPDQGYGTTVQSLYLYLGSEKLFFSVVTLLTATGTVHSLQLFLPLLLSSRACAIVPMHVYVKATISSCERALLHACFKLRQVACCQLCKQKHHQHLPPGQWSCAQDARCMRVPSLTRCCAGAGPSVAIQQLGFPWLLLWMMCLAACRTRATRRQPSS